MIYSSYPPQFLPKSCVFIDGENFRHSLIDLFDTQFDPKDHLPHAARWDAFFSYLANASYQSQRIRSYWYVVGDVDYWPYRLPKEEDKLIKVLSKHKPYQERISQCPMEKRSLLVDELKNELNKRKRIMAERFHGWDTIHDAIALKTDALEFRKSGAIRYDLFSGEFGTEKAVDVKLAVDLLELRPLYDIAIVVSGDGDYVPAVQVVKDSGKRVINVSFKTRNGRLLPGGAYRLNLITDRVLEVPYDWMHYFMGFRRDAPPEPPPTIQYSIAKVVPIERPPVEEKR